MKQFICLLGIILLLAACQKNVARPQPVDLSAQWIVDGLGNLVFGTADGQWQSKTFSLDEQFLFNSMDTASLAGTTKPEMVLENTLNYNSSFPNPFTQGGQLLRFQFTTGYAGQVELKMVYVDSVMTPRFKTAIRVQAMTYPSPTPSATPFIAVHPMLPVGRYRLYYTLSSEGSPHFYKSWGNVQTVQ